MPNYVTATHPPAPSRSGKGSIGGGANPPPILPSLITKRRGAWGEGWAGGLGMLALTALTILAGCHKPAADGAAGAEAEKKGPDEVVVETALAQTHSMDVVVQAQGTLSPGQGAVARLASPAPGRLGTVTVKEGDRVGAGQLLATVDNRPQQMQARSAAAAVTSADALAQEADMAARASATDQANAVRLSNLALSSAQLDRDNSVKQAETALQSVQTDLQKTRAGARAQEIALADQAVNQAKATRDRAATELDRVKFLFDKGVDSRRQLDDAQTALAVADAALESSRQSVSLIKSGARPEDLRAAELRVQQAREAVSQAKTSGDAKVAQAQASLRQARQSALQVAVKQQDARVQRNAAEQKRADLSAAQATAATAQIHSPFAGVVTRRLLNPGDLADTTNPILEIAQPTSLNLVAYLPVEDGQKVRTGMSARITAADVPGTAFGGRVLSIGQVDPLTNLLTVRIAVANSGAALRAGTFATAEIILRTDPRAVVVPKQAIVTKDGAAVVYVVGPDDTAHSHPVTTGVEQGGLVQIIQGVKAGDKVIKLGQYAIADGAKVKEASKDTGKAN